MRLLALVAGVLLLAAVLFVAHELDRPKSHAKSGGGPADPEPDSENPPEPPNAA